MLATRYQSPVHGAELTTSCRNNPASSWFDHWNISNCGCNKYLTALRAPTGTENPPAPTRTAASNPRASSYTLATSLPSNTVRSLAARAGITTQPRRALAPGPSSPICHLATTRTPLSPPSTSLIQQIPQAALQPTHQLPMPPPSPKPFPKLLAPCPAVPSPASGGADSVSSMQEKTQLSLAYSEVAHPEAVESSTAAAAQREPGFPVHSRSTMNYLTPSLAQLGGGCTFSSNGWRRGDERR